MHDHQSQLFCFVCYLLLASQSTCYFFKHIIFSAEEMSVRQEASELGFEYVILIIPESNVDASQRVYFVGLPRTTFKLFGWYAIPLRSAKSKI